MRLCDACWLEDELAQNSLSAILRDPSLLVLWLEQDAEIDFYGVTEKDFTAYIAHRRTDKATIKRRLIVFKHFYRLSFRMNLFKRDPPIGSRNTEQALRFPRVLSEKSVYA